MPYIQELLRNNASMTIFDKPQWSLYSGLTCVLIAIVCQRMGVNPILFWLFLAFGIGFKILFLFRVFRVSKVHLGVGLYLLLSGIFIAFNNFNSQKLLARSIFSVFIILCVCS